MSDKAAAAGALAKNASFSFYDLKACGVQAAAAAAAKVEKCAREYKLSGAKKNFLLRAQKCCLNLVCDEIINLSQQKHFFYSQLELIMSQTLAAAAAVDDERACKKDAHKPTVREHKRESVCTIRRL